MSSVDKLPRSRERDLEGWAGALFDGIDDAVFVHDQHGNILEANPAACRRLGYTREEMLRLTTRDIDEPDFASGFQDRLRSQLASGTFRCEGRHRAKDGRIIPVDINTSAIRFQGKPAVLAVMRDITQRKQAEEALQKQQRLLQSILDNMGDAVIVADASAEFLVFNPAAERMFGLDSTLGGAPEPYGLFLPDQVTPFPADALPLTRCIRGEEVDGVEMFVRHEQAPHGLWTSITGRPLRNESGQVRGGVIVCRDITERKRVEKALRDSEALYQSLVDCLPQNIFRKNLEGRLTFANKRYCATLKRSLADLIGKTDFDLFPVEMAAKYLNDDQRVLESGLPFEAVEEHLLPDNTRIYVQVVKMPIRDAQGSIIGTQGIFWDVTEKTRAEEAVSESERRYRQLTEATQDAIIVAGQEGTITLFNPAAERMFGYQAAEVLGKPLTILMAEEYEGLHNRGFQRYLTTRQSRLIGRVVELRARRKDGSEFPVELALSVLTVGTAGTDGKEPVQFLGAIRDLSERNRMRAVVIQNEKLASIGLLSAGVAHEINNPLAFVANNLVVLERDGKGLMDLVDHYHAHRQDLARANPEAVAQAEAIAEQIDLVYVHDNLSRLLKRTREGVDRVTRIVHSLRGLARTDAPKRQDTYLPDLIDTSMEILRGRLRRGGIEVVQDHDAVPRVPCVNAQISQVLLNLLVNAAQAIEATGRHSGRITIKTRRLEGEMLIEVADNGCGIHPNDLPKVFDPFFTTKDVGEGTGLGLSITHNIVTGHGGRVEVESQLGQGSCFRVYLPLHQATRDPR